MKTSGSLTYRIIPGHLHDFEHNSQELGSADLWGQALTLVQPTVAHFGQRSTWGTFPPRMNSV